MNRQIVMSESPNADGPLVLSADSLGFRYAENDVVNVARFALAPGESKAVIGPSGCGKTTLLHLLAGLLTPHAGRVCILGQDIGTLSAAQLDRFRGQNIGMVFQRLFLLPALTVRQNIELAQQMARKPRNADRVQALLSDLGLAELADRKPRMLSQGQAQRVAIARALVHSPSLVLADEPTSALDDDRAMSALNLLKNSALAVGAALLVVTHDQRVRGQLDSEFEMESLS